MNPRLFRSRFAAALILLVSCAGSTATAAEWQMLKDEHFTVAMPPGKLEPQVQFAKDGQGKNTVMTRLYLARENGILFAAAWSEYYVKITDPEAELEADCNNYNKAVHAILVNKERTTFAGYPAIRFTSAREDKSIRFASWLVLVGENQVYQVAAAYTATEEPAIVTSFLQSLHIIIPAPAETEKK